MSIMISEPPARDEEDRMPQKIQGNYHLAVAVCATYALPN